MKESICTGKNNVIIGHSIICTHDNCVMIGTSLEAIADNMVIIGNSVINATRTMTSQELEVLRKTLFETFAS